MMDEANIVKWGETEKDQEFSGGKHLFILLKLDGTTQIFDQRDFIAYRVFLPAGA